jgi:hypothetical protein
MSFKKVGYLWEKVTFLRRNRLPIEGNLLGNLKGYLLQHLEVLLFVTF